MNTQTIVRCIFLIFITCLAVYFLLVNKDSRSIEKFEEVKLTKNKDELAKIIIELYTEIYTNDLALKNPSKKAVEFYVDYAIQRNITRAELKQVISGSSVALERTFNNKEEQKETTEVFGTEDEVTDIYNKILFRNPDVAELYNFSKMLKNDKSFDIEKLEQILYGSQEHKRLEKTQTNKVYSNLMGGVTERQLDMIIEDVFEEVTRGNETLDDDTKRFLKRKFIGFNLDENKLRAFIEKYVAVDQTVYSTKQEQSVYADQTVYSTQQERSVYADQTVYSTQQERSVYADQTVYSTKQEQSVYDAQTNAPNQQVIEGLLKTANNNRKENYLDSQDVLQRIKEDAKCVFDKDAKDNNWAHKVDNRLARLQDERNTEELKNICIRNKNFLGADEDMVLDASQKWSVPQRRSPVCIGNNNTYQPLVTQTALIGTLLEEAKDTKVGSILPENVPR